MALKRLPTQKLEEESKLAIRSIINQMNCQYRELSPDNSGIDGEIELTDQFNFTGKVLRCQIKAGSSYIARENSEVIKIRVEKRYVDHWNGMNFPVILFFYHPDSKQIYWKSIKNYLEIEKSLLKKETNRLLIPFNKVYDLFSASNYTAFLSIIEGNFHYENIKYSDKESEIIISNWFPIVELPQTVYKAPTKYRERREITDILDGYYAFILKEEAIYSFSNLSDDSCELSIYCEKNNTKLHKAEEMQENYLTELLNSTLRINAWQNDLIPDSNRSYFSPKVLSGNNEFSYPSLTGRDETRIKIYRFADNEYKHHAVKLSFHKTGDLRFLEIEPDWYFSYPKIDKSNREIGIRITKEKSKMYNKDYLYLLHFWKQYLSKNTDSIVLPCDNSPISQKVIVSLKNVFGISDFSLLNDYSAPKGFIDESKN